MIRVVVVLLIATIGLGSAWQLERARSRVALQDQTILSLQEQAKKDDDNWVESHGALTEEEEEA